MEKARSRRFHWKWVLPLLPWAWFLVRSVHPFLDYVAIGLPVLLIAGVIASLLFSLAFRNGFAIIIAASLSVMFLVAVISPMRPSNFASPASSVRIATMNLGLSWFSDNDAGFFIFEEQPDLLVGMELAESHHAEFESRFEFHEADILSLEEQQANEAGLTPVGDTFRRNGLPSIGVYSNLPITVMDDPVVDQIPGGLPGFRVRVEGDDGPFILYALHIPRPFPGDGAYELAVSEHFDMVTAIRDAIEAEELPVVLAGDLNTVDRGHSYRVFTGSLNDAMRQSGWAVPTSDRPFPWSLLFARLDHVLISEELCAENGESRDTRYADHRPLVVDVGPCDL